MPLNNKFLVLAFLFLMSSFAGAVDTAVLQGIALGDTPSIERAGSSCDQAYVPVLKRQSKVFRKKSEQRRWIRASLARLGDERSFRLIVKDLRSKKPIVAQNAISDLKFVGGPKAAGALRGVILSSKKRFNVLHCEEDMNFLPHNDTASWALFELLKTPPKDRAELLRMYKDGRLAFWRKWLSTHSLEDKVKEGCSVPAVGTIAH